MATGDVDDADGDDDNEYDMVVMTICLMFVCLRYQHRHTYSPVFVLKRRLKCMRPSKSKLTPPKCRWFITFADVA